MAKSNITLPVFILFSENAGQWGEHGSLRRVCRCARTTCVDPGCASVKFILEVGPREGGGTRVLPLVGRTAEVYLTGRMDLDPVVQTADAAITVDNFVDIWIDKHDSEIPEPFNPPPSPGAFLA